MPVRQVPVTENAIRVLLDGVVDYAGLFPPASLDMAFAVRNFAHYRGGGSGWMLGRFVCPVKALDDFSVAADPFLPRDAGAIPWRLAVTGSGHHADDFKAIGAFNMRHRVCFDECSALVDVFETRTNTVADIEALAAMAPPDLVTYLEIPVADDPASLVRALARAGRRAKLRTGGVHAESFPTAEQIVRFLEVCAREGVTAKATAGLHHPLRDSYRLTYEPDAPKALMFGFLNVFLASAMVADGAPARDVKGMLEERDPNAFRLRETSISWRGGAREYVLERGLLAQVRERGLVSFGSCSFMEPVQETRALGLL